MGEVSVEPPLRVEFPTVHAGGFPWGLRCAICQRPIAEGEPYAERADSLSPNGMPFSLLTCVYCPGDRASQVSNCANEPVSEMKRVAVGYRVRALNPPGRWRWRLTKRSATDLLLSL